MDHDELQVRLIALRDGDRAAFTEIYEALKTPMYTIILRITQDAALSEDALQGVFIKLYQSPPEPSVNARAYLFQMARNAAIDSVRTRRKQADWESAKESLYTTAEADSLPDAVDIESALNTLPPVEIQIVSLHVNAELTFREIADILGMPLGTVLWRYQRAIGRLRTILSEV